MPESQDNFKTCVDLMGQDNAELCAYGSMIGFASAGQIITQNKDCPAGSWYLPGSKACRASHDHATHECPKGFTGDDGHCMKPVSTKK